MPRVLLFASTTGYQVHSFAEAAERLGFELILATDRCHMLDDPWGDRAVPVRFDDPAEGFALLKSRGPFDGVLAVGDQPASMAAQAAERVGIAFSSPDAVAAAKSKFLSRERFKSAGMLVPEYRLVNHINDALSRYPCVLKPVGLSASRGVIRANDADEFIAAFARIKRLVEREEDQSIQIEDFIPGREFALEGLVTNGKLQTLALFDKPDPLDGPYFEETIYVTPSREPDSVIHAIRETAQQAVSALGLTQGPVHAEMRVNDRGVWMLEVAARPIGGLCSRVLRFANGETLEEVLLRHAIGDDVSALHLAPGGHGVMMIPIPRAGVYRGVSGLDDARAVDGVEDIVIAAKEGQSMVPLPEGASYLGFIFAHAGTRELAEAALRQSHACLRFNFSTSMSVIK
jgi:biotin carboxylase